MESPGRPLRHRLTAAMAEYDVLEPWLTESHGDDAYWVDEARAVFSLVGESPSGPELRAALAEVLAEAFGAFEDNGLLRDDLDARLDLILARTLEHP